MTQLVTPLVTPPPAAADEAFTGVAVSLGADVRPCSDYRLRRVAWHVTPTSRLEGVLRRGLLLDPPEQTFRSRRAVCLATSESDARRWAGELARAITETQPDDGVAAEAGAGVEMALLEVNVTAVMSVAVPTSLGVDQVVVHSNLGPELLRVVDVFTAAPVPRPANSRTAG